MGIVLSGCKMIVGNAEAGIIKKLVIEHAQIES